MSIETIILIVLYTYFGLFVAVEINCPKEEGYQRNRYLNSDIENNGGLMMFLLFLPIIVLHLLFLKLFRLFLKKNE